MEATARRQRTEGVADPSRSTEPGIPFRRGTQRQQHLFAVCLGKLGDVAVENAGAIAEPTMNFLRDCGLRVIPFLLH